MSEDRVSEVAASYSQGAAPSLSGAEPGPGAGSTFSLRLATTTAEREAIYRLRYEIYAIENGFGVQGADATAEWTDASDWQADHLYAAASGELVGALRIVYGADAVFPDALRSAYDLARFTAVVPYEQMAITSRFAVKRAYRASSAALHLLIESARLQRARGVALSFGDCPLNLLSYYTAIGFRTYAPPYHHPVAGALVPLVLVAGDLVYLRQIGSPLCTLAEVLTPERDETAERVRSLLGTSSGLRGPRGEPRDVARFWQELQDVLGPPPFQKGPLAGLDTNALRGLLSLSYLIDWKGGPLLRRGQPVTERWLLLSGQLAVDGCLAAPLTLVGGADEPGGLRHCVDAHVGEGGARLLSIDERKLRQTLATAGSAAEPLRLALRGVSGLGHDGQANKESKKSC